MSNFILDLKPFLYLTDDQYYELCRKHPDLKLERNRAGQLIIMPPTGGETGRKNADIISQLVVWNKKKKLGVVFDSSTEFKLPLGGDRSPDAAWIKLEHWRSLSDESKKKFPPLCPDFIIELRSESDSLKELRAKMQEYLDNGMALGWLIDPQNQQVEVYKQNQDIETINSPQTLSGGEILPKFILDFAEIWN
ncbi:Uma2 family endonuclease [Gloeocapsopsis dulcis]|uniref:Putative restriction endonuclease domain-containing protein n=1 Tax=Gloeocapsopsis dulcis AAB1 = 1H9 TaxID=1433147 RepID=A0A6N8FT69_9CHRO|nr:Uma2 family endonuclease [Gloeocapsopsis dulcis]MUL36293.1 hypothetical protein [Gloeocapsopsis dulcis AAB1 = 1H9]WNN89597.1 Uma2 family endonuclease [Gloeocapsopsis dulcis]